LFYQHQRKLSLSFLSLSVYPFLTDLITEPMDVSCATSANPLNIYNNLRARYHPHHPEEASQHRLLSQQHHQQQLGPYDDDATSSGGHSEAVMWEKYRQQPHNDNDKPPFYMVQDDLITPSSSHYPRHQSSYFYADTRMPSTASLSLIYNTNNQPLASTNTRDFLETVESPLFIDRHQQTNVTTNKESLKQNSNRVSSSIKTEKDGMQREQNLLNEFDDNESRNATTIEDSPPKKKDKKYVTIYTADDM
jgi:hypothetical protein